MTETMDQIPHLAEPAGAVEPTPAAIDESVESLDQVSENATASPPESVAAPRQGKVPRR